MFNLTFANFMTRSTRKIFLGTLLLVTAIPVAVWAQPSIIADMLVAQASLVTVESENTDLFKTDPAVAGINKETGQILLTRKLTKASVKRNSAGVIIHASGIIVTNAHAVAKANTIKVILKDQTAVPAQVAAFISNIDLALLVIRPPYPLKALPLADSDKVTLGEDIISIGSSSFLNQTVTGGKIIGLGSSRSHQGPKHNQLLQTSLNVYQGDSGGPLFNRQGQLIGLVTAKETAADHSSFAVPSNLIAEYLNNYLTQKKSSPNRP